MRAAAIQNWRTDSTLTAEGDLGVDMGLDSQKVGCQFVQKGDNDSDTHILGTDGKTVTVNSPGRGQHTLFQLRKQILVFTVCKTASSLDTTHRISQEGREWGTASD